MLLRINFTTPKGSKSITDFLQEIEGVVDELALIGVATDGEDLVLKILNGLDELYREISGAIQAREHPIRFDELHEKLLSTKAQLASRHSNSTSPPSTAFYSAIAAPKQKLAAASHPPNCKSALV